MTDSERATIALAHEMRGPLTAIHGWLAMLQSGELPSHRFPHALDVLSRNAARLSSLVDDAFDAARIRSGRPSVTVAPIDLRTVVDEVIDSVEPAAIQADVRLNRTHPPLPVKIKADAGRIAQVVRNLVLNAIEFTPAAGRVEVVTTLCEAGARLVVSDTGAGIPPAQLTSIFEPFQQAHTTRRSRRGLGMGLSIVREIVELHGGRVVAISAGPGKGSAFIVSLPGVDGAP